MMRWYPEAIRQQQPDNGAMSGGPAKGLLHSTESRFGQGWASFNPGTHPHFEVTARTGSRSVSVRQYFPLDQPSRSLVDGPLAVRTNRDGVIQVELGFQAFYVAQVPDWFWAGCRPLLRWIEDNAGVDPYDWATFKPYPASYGTNNGVRFSPYQWDNFGGWCGHMHVPDGNSHGDPGLVPVEKLRRPPPPPPETDMDLKELVDALRDTSSPISLALRNNIRLAVQAELEDERNQDNPGQVKP